MPNVNLLVVITTLRHQPEPVFMSKKDNRYGNSQMLLSSCGKCVKGVIGLVYVQVSSLIYLEVLFLMRKRLF